MPVLVREFKYENAMEVPASNKVVINIGLGEAISNPKAIDAAVKDLTAIAGQKPVVKRAKKSMANFKVRAGNPIGLMVTLRGQRDVPVRGQAVSDLSAAHQRDFQGISGDAFDGRGNYTLGFKEQLVFPEIEYDKVDKVRGLEISIVTTAKTDQEGKRFCCSCLGMPFRPRRRGQGDHGQEVEDREVEADRQVQRSAAQPLPRLRSTAGLHSEVRPLPHLLPACGAGGRAAGRHEVQLVGETWLSARPVADRASTVG